MICFKFYRKIRKLFLKLRDSEFRVYTVQVHRTLINNHHKIVEANNFQQAYTVEKDLKPLNYQQILIRLQGTVRQST